MEQKLGDIVLSHDKSLDIATASSRRAKVWRNESILWSDLLKRLRQVTRTPETAAEYRIMPRERQTAVKDVGGFVGGYCEQGRRSAVCHRSLLCLDADFAGTELWPDWLMLFGNAAAIYSTHKHTPAKPRLRLIIPLARDVTPEEYPAVGRRVAAMLGIDQFDDSTYQPQRAMFWPSASRDAAYVFEYHDGDFLDPDAMLATYRDWRDLSSWPMSSRIAEIAVKRAGKQADPTDKGGLIGAFCRAYPIQDAIAQFIPAYQPCAEENRYTYAGGSTAAGVVIYDEKFSYSHHATDPASGQLCNAWDLVRIHRFGALDADCDQDERVSSRPSYKAMAQLASEDARVREQIVADRMAEAERDYSTPEGGDWRALLKVTEKGVLAQTIENVVTILTYDPAFANGIAFDEMTHGIVAVRDLPWSRLVNGPRRWTDGDDASLRYHLERVYGLTGKDRIFDGVNVVAQAHAFHPVREFLDGCIWDGQPRLDRLLIDYLGAEDTPYTRAVTRKALTAAAARIYRPGCKFDYMLTIRGAQGIGKSALVAKLGGAWYSDTFTTLQGKDAYEQVQGVWIVEVGELAGLRRAEIETIKLYISKQADHYRPAYGRRLQEFPRQCIFIGTTNEEQFLRDATGNRRFWVVDTPNAPTRSIWQDLTDEEIRQIWGEAVAAFRAGETLYLSEELEQEARLIQEQYEEENPNAGMVEAYLKRLLPVRWPEMDLYERRQWLESDAVGTEQRKTVCLLEIWVEALHGSPDRFDRMDRKDLRDIMGRMKGWKSAGRRQITVPVYGRQRYYHFTGGGTKS